MFEGRPKRMMGELAALGAAICWTISAVLYKEALADVKPISANIVRLASTSAIVILFLVIIGKFGVLTSLSSHVVGLALISGVIGLGFGDTLYLISLRSIGVARAVPITCIYPLFNLLWAVFLKGEHVTEGIVFGAVAIVFGIWLLSLEKEPNTHETQKKKLVKGMASALATAVLWSVSITMINMAVKETPSLEHAFVINIIRITAVGFSLLALSFIVDKERGFLKMQKKTLAMIIAGGVIALGLGWFFLTYSFTETLESRAVPISSTTPLFSTLSGIMFLHEKVTWKNAAGSIIIVIGIFLIFMI